MFSEELTYVLQITNVIRLQIMERLNWTRESFLYKKDLILVLIRYRQREIIKTGISNLEAEVKGK